MTLYEQRLSLVRTVAAAGVTSIVVLTASAAAATTTLVQSDTAGAMVRAEDGALRDARFAALITVLLGLVIGGAIWHLLVERRRGFSFVHTGPTSSAERFLGAAAGAFLFLGGSTGVWPGYSVAWDTDHATWAFAIIQAGIASRFVVEIVLVLGLWAIALALLSRHEANRAAVGARSKA